MKLIARTKRAARFRSKLKRRDIYCLTVHRTSRHIYAQVTSMGGSKTLMCASTTEKKIRKELMNTGNKRSASMIGQVIARRCITIGIKKVCFDRSGFKYHGRVLSLAESARSNGLEF
ncbi:50S ribosomal protein L18 [Candidatus Riesia pediculischaeffi]|nr:LSU ribosomal protein L18p (L5e) [Candidatus Riesia pediculischaeffi PTSU]